MLTRALHCPRHPSIINWFTVDDDVIFHEANFIFICGRVVIHRLGNFLQKKNQHSITGNSSEPVKFRVESLLKALSTVGSWRANPVIDNQTLFQLRHHDTLTYSTGNSSKKVVPRKTKPRKNFLSMFNNNIIRVVIISIINNQGHSM